MCSKDSWEMVLDKMMFIVFAAKIGSQSSLRQLKSITNMQYRGFRSVHMTVSSGSWELAIQSRFLASPLGGRESRRKVNGEDASPPPHPKSRPSTDLQAPLAP